MTPPPWSITDSAVARCAHARGSTMLQQTLETDMTCNHEHARRHSRDYGYSGTVAVHPYTDENRAAHGCITYTEECTACGARRSVNANGGHHEYSPWRGSHAGRRDAVASAAATVRQLLDTRPALGYWQLPDGRDGEIWIDDEGYLAIHGYRLTDADHTAIAVSSGMLDHARALRVATKALCDARAEEA